MTLEALGIVGVGLLAAWMVGGVLLRVGGLVLVLVGLSGLALFDQVGGVLTAALGALLWLAGHWHYALRHQRYKSPLARILFGRWAPAWLDPTRERFEPARPDRGGAEVARATEVCGWARSRRRCGTWRGG